MGPLVLTLYVAGTSSGAGASLSAHPADRSGALLGRTSDVLSAQGPRRVVEGVDGLHDVQGFFAGDGWRNIHVGAGPCGGADERGKTAAPLRIFESPHLGLLG